MIVLNVFAGHALESVDLLILDIFLYTLQIQHQGVGCG